MKRKDGHRDGTLANILILIFAVSLVALIVNAAVFFGGKVLEWIR